MRCRPLTRKERQQGSHVITRTIDEKVNAQMTMVGRHSWGGSKNGNAASLERQLPTVQPQHDLCMATCAQCSLQAPL